MWSIKDGFFSKSKARDYCYQKSVTAKLTVPLYYVAVFISR